MKYLLSIALPLALIACVPTEPVAVSQAALRPADLSVARAEVRELLRDPEGARFRREVAYRSAAGDTIICGELNATNGFGGYVGYAPYYVRMRGGQVEKVHADEFLSRIACDEARKGQLNLPVPASSVSRKT